MYVTVAAVIQEVVSRRGEFVDARVSKIRLWAVETNTGRPRVSKSLVRRLPLNCFGFRNSFEKRRRCRSGVDLKDKWRNLEKFGHVSIAEKTRIRVTFKNLRVEAKQKKVKEPPIVMRHQRYIGVFPDGDRWAARIIIDGHVHDIGSFAYAQDAARAYDTVASVHLDKYGCTRELNFNDAEPLGCLDLNNPRTL